MTLKEIFEPMPNWAIVLTVTMYGISCVVHGFCLGRHFPKPPKDREVTNNPEKKS